ncbi:MAG: SGNH/GDSL hydrolase family protein, partial [Eubacteriales bacterium]
MLTNTAYRLNREKKLTIGFFGGSVTEGAGASSWDETSWRANITRDLKETYPDAEITAVNAAIGGTGTDLGLYRCEHDLLQYNPNLVFIEFAANDSLLTPDEQFKCYESCLRQILSKDPTTEIVVVFTMTKYFEEKLLTFGDFRSRTAETMLAYHYGLDMINIGEHFRMVVAANGGDWMKYTVDNVHPNDEGYLILTEAMKRELSRLLTEIPDALTAKTLPSPYCEKDTI